MSVVQNIRKFLQTKFEMDTSLRQKLIKEGGVPPSVVSGLINERKVNPNLISIVKIADYFDCSIAIVIGNDKYNNKKFVYKKLTQDQISNNLKDNISKLITNKQIKPVDLSKNIGIAENSIKELIKEDSRKKLLSLKSIIGLSNYLEVTIDELIGRM
ncbi:MULTISPECIES: helix-turn-helix domain-containing protein [spotted fever group]|uniref:HTH cro/C1-type domain-containing protein n=1 Tax=Rickettsia tamurae subsp. buchneri TaxID=1462938 RepID=A0A8E0WKD6_9RICK|nr:MULTISPECIES: helix-turn-helix transcriptional regulator [spotted fever group]KDO02109.1 hypothetical protein REISMN_08630 [Rickettsia tamurae subsp. buchneri]HJD66835.1 helix-turn-helix transcriptional regulator [Rickettsia endosymbiont of Bembidion nr. Transversale]